MTQPRLSGIPANGLPCQACWGTGRILFHAPYWIGPCGMQGSHGIALPGGGIIPCAPTAGPFYMARCRDTGGGMWPRPDVNNPCPHCDGTGVMGPLGEPVSA